MPRSWIVVLLAAVVCAPVHADTLATVQAADGEILLLTERCGSPDSRIQRAVERTRGRRLEGCWSVNARGNPVVMWGDGRLQELPESRVRLAPKYAAMLEDEPRRSAGDAAGMAERRQGSRARTAAAAVDGSIGNAPAAAEGSDFPRAAWCTDAAFPHEKLVCRDRELAAADLALAPLWRSYRDALGLTPVQQGRVKSEYFRRLKACGADKPCIQRQQDAQARLYRESLASPR